MGTHHRGSEAEIRALDTFIKLSRAADTIGMHALASYADTGLTTSQFGTLETLYHLGPMCQTEIGKKILRSSGNITLVIDNLEKRGLVRRERAEDDRRRVGVHLTPEGRKLIEGVFPEHVAMITAAFGALTPSEQDELGRLCRKLGKAVAGLPVARDVRQSVPREARQSVPREARQSVPREARQSVARDVGQSVPREARQSAASDVRQPAPREVRQPAPREVRPPAPREVSSLPCDAAQPLPRKAAG